jgi:hypothetical protein
MFGTRQELLELARPKPETYQRVEKRNTRLPLVTRIHDEKYHLLHMPDPTRGP